MLTAAWCVLAILGACSSGSNDQVAADQSPDRSVVTERTLVTTRSEITESESTESETTAPGDTAPTSVSQNSATTSEPIETTSSTSEVTDNGLLRLAPAGQHSSELLQWDAYGVTTFGHNGIGVTIPLDELSEIAAVPYGPIVFQTTDNQRVIWQLVDEEPQGFLVVPDNEQLTLEGAGLDAEGESVIYYQWRVYGDPMSTVSKLMEYRFIDGAIREITTTGGWESGTSFGQIGSTTTVGLWGAEGWEGVQILDLTTGDVSFDSEDLGIGCFFGEVGCPSFASAVLIGGDIIGMGPAPTGDIDTIDAFGLLLYDTATGSLETMQRWPWDIGEWYVEDMFTLGDSLIVVSLVDGDGGPLPALLFDAVSGESWTEPTAAFVRRFYLS
jgi:hypothetical protein